MITHLPDVVQRALDLAPSVMREDPIARAFVEAVGAATQAVENDTFDLVCSLPFDVAHGVILDRWGKALGEVRGGLDDDDYRSLIAAKLAAMISPGDFSSILGIIATLCAPCDLTYSDTPPAGLEVAVRRDSYMGPRRLARVSAMIRSIRPAGVSMWVTESIPGSFGADDNPPLDVGELSRVVYDGTS